MALSCALLALSILLSPWGPGSLHASAQPLLERVDSQALFDAAGVWPPVTVQGGAWLDVDGDGDLDFVLPGAPDSGAFLVWVENADGAQLRTAPLDPMIEGLPGPPALGVRQVVLAADFDNDGRTDLFLSGCMSLPPAGTFELAEEEFQPEECSTAILFENLGNGKFRAHVDNGIKPVLLGTGTSAGDADGDGLLDLYVSDGRLLGAVVEPTDTYGNKLYINKGGFRFEDSGLSVDNPWACVSAFVDFDYDGDQDIVTGACFEVRLLDAPANGSGMPLAAEAGPVLLLKNTLKETGALGFEDVTEELWGGVPDGLWMSVVMADINGDGVVDFYVGNWGEVGGPNADPTMTGAPLPHLLMVSQPGGTWADEAAERGVADHAFNWGGAFVDLNNDGHVDLVTVGAINMPGAVVSNNGSVFLNDGAGNFSRAADLGIEEVITGGLSVADFDEDGSQDLMVVGQARDPAIPEGIFNDAGRLFLFRGTAAKERHVAFVLEGVESNRAGIGAFATLCPAAADFGDASTPDVQCQQRVLTAGSGAFSTHSPVFHFGVGTSVSAVDLTVLWPSGKEDVHAGVEVGNRYRLREGGEMEQV